MEVDMTIDLTPRWKDFAVYLPALQFGYASDVVDNKRLKKDRNFPQNIKLTDLDFLNPKSKLWHYGYGLYSAGQFDSMRPRADAITQRNRNKEIIILGDSGGYQIGKGTLKGASVIGKATDGASIAKAWKETRIREWIVEWLDEYSDYAMTIDMPLWARYDENSNSPFHKCTVQELIKISVDNLEFIKNKSTHQTKWLNVIQGTDYNDWKLWWNAVKKYRFSGWALAGSVGWRGIRENKELGIEKLDGMYSLLQTMLTMNDDNAFEKGQEWTHVLGVSQPTWAVMLTSIQRTIRKHCNNPTFKISYDSASPFQAGGRYQRVVRYPKLLKDIKTWAMTMHLAPINSNYYDSKQDYRFPYSSPIGDLLTLRDLNVRGGLFQNGAFDTISNHIITNHNVWVYVRSFLEANEIAFMQGSESVQTVPESMLELMELIDTLFATERWTTLLKKNKNLISEVFKRVKFAENKELNERDVRYYSNVKNENY